MKSGLTVCVPHVSRNKLLAKCVDSILSNVKLPFHILVVHDGACPLNLEDDRISLVPTGFRRSGLGFKRAVLADLADTEYVCFVDNDIQVQPNSLEFQVKALEDNHELAAVSGFAIHDGELPKFSGVADLVFFGNILTKIHYSTNRILSDGSDGLFHVDYIPIGYTTFRACALEDVAFDPHYLIGYEHLDTFLQLRRKGWKFAVHKNSFFVDMAAESPEDYRVFRKDITRILASKSYFAKKWGLHHLDETEKSLLGKCLFRLLVLWAHIKNLT